MVFQYCLLIFLTCFCINLGGSSSRSFSTTLGKQSFVFITVHKVNVMSRRLWSGLLLTVPTPSQTYLTFSTEPVSWVSWGMPAGSLGSWRMWPLWWRSDLPPPRRAPQTAAVWRLEGCDTYFSSSHTCTMQAFFNGWYREYQSEMSTTIMRLFLQCYARLVMERQMKLEAESGFLFQKQVFYFCDWL